MTERRPADQVIGDMLDSVFPDAPPNTVRDAARSVIAVGRDRVLDAGGARELRLLFGRLSPARRRDAARTARAKPTYATSEPTRLLCAGVHLDAGFRRRVIEELVEHDERAVAPSLGFDAVPVLAHALLARRHERLTALLMLPVWAAFAWCGGWWAAAYAMVSAALWGARAFTGRGTSTYATARSPAPGVLGGALTAVARLMALGYWAVSLYALIRVTQDATTVSAVAGPLLLCAAVWVHRSRTEAVARHTLDRHAFATFDQRALLPRPERYEHILSAIEHEQHTDMVVYDPSRAFVGLGRPCRPYSLALGGGQPQPGGTAGQLTGRELLDRVEQRLAALRAASHKSRDQLGDLEFQEVTYLPAGLPRLISYEPGAELVHVRNVGGDVGEVRRPFLRIRVGAWNEQVVLTVLVRAVGRGGALALEVLPFVLAPPRPEFAEVEVMAARRKGDTVRRVFQALTTGPSAAFATALGTARSLTCALRPYLAAQSRRPSAAPLASVRELGSSAAPSYLQQLDVQRYLMMLQAEVLGAARDALRERGQDTAVVERLAVAVRDGGLFIPDDGDVRPAGTSTPSPPRNPLR